MDNWYRVMIDSGDELERNLTFEEANKLKDEYNNEPEIREIGTCFVEIQESGD